MVGPGHVRPPGAHSRLGDPYTGRELPKWGDFILQGQEHLSGLADIVRSLQAENTGVGAEQRRV
jgi:hypothetical protein